MSPWGGSCDHGASPYRGLVAAGDSPGRSQYSDWFDKYATRYLAEVQRRFNRRFDLPRMIPRLQLRACAQTTARPEKWLRLAEAWG